ncbi:MAG: hypothetical protein EA360_00530 [Balneolaceae bacterium]|nr:MAG: hypothetical protein EA360_00530 [Balneolaceae bacterium]
MDKEKLEYIEEAGLAFELFGMTRMAGRIFGYLVVSDQEVVSFEQIRETLKASKGSISGTTKNLIHVGFIEPVSLPGDRKTYFRISRQKAGRILKERTALFLKFGSLLDRGRALKAEEDRVSDWLLEISSFYKWMVHEVDMVTDKWEMVKEGYMQKMKGEEDENSEKK